MQKFLEDEQFLRLELPKLIEEEKARASDDDIDLTIRTSGGDPKFCWLSGFEFVLCTNLGRFTFDFPVVIEAAVQSHWYNDKTWYIMLVLYG